MLSSLTRKLSVLQTSSADNMAQQKFRVLISVPIFNSKHPSNHIASDYTQFFLNNKLTKILS